MSNSQAVQAKKKVRQALIVWCIFFAATVTINLLLPFAMGLNLQDWTHSDAKGLLLFSVDYAGLFLVVPLLLAKGWTTFKKPSFSIPVAVAAVSVVIWNQLPYVAAIVLVAYAYLHWRFDLSTLGFRSKGWKGDAAAILMVGALGLVSALSSSGALQIAVVPALGAALFRMLANPASTVENLFYFGFLTERLGVNGGWKRFLVPFAVGAMYTMHEMTNPEYWYEGVSFAFIFVGVVVFASVYLWRRNIVVTWLSDGFRWFINALL